MKLVVTRTLSALVVLVLAACSSSDGGENTSSSSSSSGSSSGAVGCKNDPRITTMSQGLSAKSASGAFTAEIIAADPATPRRGAGEAGMNVWTMKLSLDGQTIGDAATVTTFMPDHGHGSPKTPVIQPNGDGTAKVSTIFFFMAGVWQVTVTPNARREPATFTLCVE